MCITNCDVIPQNLPPPALTDDEMTSGSDDVIDQPANHRRLTDETRYEEATIRDVTNERQGEPLGSKGRRVYFFRNGDVHFKPKQVSITNYHVIVTSPDCINSQPYWLQLLR